MLYAKEGGTAREQYPGSWVTKAVMSQLYCHTSIAAGYLSVSSYLKPGLHVEVVPMTVWTATGPKGIPEIMLTN